MPDKRLTPTEEPRAEPRQVVQISAAQGQFADALYALCADGSMWCLPKPLRGGATAEWVMVPPIPAVGVQPALVPARSGAVIEPDSERISIPNGLRD